MAQDAKCPGRPGLVSCVRPVRTRGYCRACYHWLWRRDAIPLLVYPDTCIIAGCVKSAHSRGWCQGHYKRWTAYGDPEASAPPRPPKPECSIEGCAKQSEVRGWCQMHYTRWLRHGNPERTLQDIENGYVHTNGYIMLTRPDHPLADRHGRVYAHRSVLYDEIGPDRHRCHWCRKWLYWGHGLHTDHLDYDPQNNHPSNLVASCSACNSQRHKPT